MSKLNIFYYAHGDLSGRLGSIGSVRHIIEVAEGLNKRGHRVCLFAPDIGNYNNETPLEIVYFPSPKIKVIGFYISCILSIVYIIYHGLKSRPDVLYVREPLYTFHTILIARILRCRHIIEVNGYQPDEIKLAGASLFRLAFLKLCETINYRFSDRIITVTDELKDKINGVYHIPLKKITHIDNGVNTVMCRPMDSMTVRKTLGLPADDLFVGFIGYFFPWSGVDNLISASPAILKELPQTKFIIIGSGTWGNHLQKQVETTGLSDRFIFTGTVPWEKVPIYINAFDIGVAPYTRRIGDKTSQKKSASSLKTFEYMSCGKPVVVTDYGGISDIVRDSACGIVVPMDSTDELSKAIIKLLTDETLRRQMGERGRQTVMDKYRWAETVRKTELVIQEIV